MRAVILLAPACLLFAACQTQPAEIAPQGSAPAMSTPVGPVVGPNGEAQNREQHEADLDPYAHDKIALQDGRRLFVQYNCYGCHGGHGGGGMGPSLRDEDWIYGSSDAHVYESIAQGRAHGMPAWGVQVPSEQIWKLVAYVKSLRSPEEPDPPPHEQ